MSEMKYYNDFVETREKLKKNKTKKFKSKLYYLGYFDGLYNEEEYKRYIPDDDMCIEIYAQGYTDGKEDRDNKRRKVIYTKSGWIEKLAVSDFKNNYRDRKLTPEAEELYNLNYDDLLMYGETTSESANDAAEILEEQNIRF